MTTTLTSNHFLLNLHPETGKFDLQSSGANPFTLSGCRMRIEISQPGSKFTLPLDHWEIQTPAVETQITGNHGAMVSLQIKETLPHSGLNATVTFALSQDRPLFL
ncbi:MAG: hypothetical protein ACYC36_12525, partial [Bellilinea sp.]